MYRDADRSEPYDDEDRALLEALASVAAVALANADLYGQVQRQKDGLSAVTTSMGEGVCAMNERGEITFMNPSGADMLGGSRFGTGRGPTTYPARREGAGLSPRAGRRAMALGRTSPAMTRGSPASTAPTSRSR